MTVLDLQQQREARRRAAYEEFCAAQEWALAETTRLVDELTPLIERWLEYEKERRKHRPRGPMCEAPHCRDTITTMHAIPGTTPDDPEALVSLCDSHLWAVHGGVTANRDETLTWRFRPVGAAPVQMTVPRKRRSRPRRPNV